MLRSISIITFTAPLSANDAGLCRRIVLHSATEPRDQHHSDAIRVSSSLRQTIVVTEFVLIELANALAEIESRQRALSLWESLRRDSNTTIVLASSDLVARGMKLYSDRLDKEWSLIDCISFVVMKEMGITDALTADHHFEQAGFVALLRQ
jgi:predicted nucleic acid-binding protein